jgi:hypothetical protein
MSKKHLEKKPHLIDEKRWWYEEPKGIYVVIYGSSTMIPWRAIRAALKRLDQKT